MSVDAVSSTAARRRWFEPLLAVVAVYALAALLVAPSTYLAMVGNYAGQMLILPPLLLVALGGAGIAMRPSAPLAAIRELALGGGLRVLAAVPVVCLGLAAFTTFKISIPHLVPFYADFAFADLDAWLHGGHNPGELAHAVVPQWASYALAYAYGPTWFLLWFGAIAFVALQPNAALRRRYYWAMTVTVVLLGTVAALLFSSVGPVFYQHFVGTDRFAPLMAMVAATPGVGEYMAEMSAYLLDNYREGTSGFGTGISAMPSMHLAIATLNALMLWRVSRWAGTVGFGYVAVILVGSVYLGWHYAIDGYFSIAVVSLTWWIVGRIQQRRAA